MEKEVVYFMKHMGLAPIKIGKSTVENIQKRYDSFRVYAPYGSELLGVIKTDDATQLEQQLHKQFSFYRLSGEWFNISIDMINEVLDLNSAKRTHTTSRNIAIEEYEVPTVTESKKDDIIRMFRNGMKRSQISNELSTPYSYVSKIINKEFPNKKYKK